MNLINKIFIKLSARKVGGDEFGNEYYQNKHKKRFVVYKGQAEPSKVPMSWHGWLHYYSDEIPVSIIKKSWEKPHLPNLSGTANAYSPNNSQSKTSCDFKPWNPNS